MADAVLAARLAVSMDDDIAHYFCRAISRRLAKAGTGVGRRHPSWLGCRHCRGNDFFRCVVVCALVVLLAESKTLAVWGSLFCHADCAVLRGGRLARLARLEPVQARMGGQRRTF